MLILSKLIEERTRFIYVVNEPTGTIEVEGCGVELKE